MLIIFPLIEDCRPLVGGADGVEHIAVALRMYRFLKCLNRKAEVHLIRRDILPDVRQVCRLDAVQKNKERQN